MVRQFFTAIHADLLRWNVPPTFFNFIKLTIFIPGFHLAVMIRLQEMILRMPFFGKILSRMLWLWTYLWTGAEVAGQSVIGHGIYFPHPSGVVIGPGTVIGANVTILSGVTLGLISSIDGIEEQKYPVIGDGVMIGSGAKIIGPVKVGNGVRIGANAVVISDIPDNYTAVGVPARHFPKK